MVNYVGVVLESAGSIAKRMSKYLLRTVTECSIEQSGGVRV